MKEIVNHPIILIFLFVASLSSQAQTSFRFKVIFSRSDRAGFQVGIAGVGKENQKDRDGHDKYVVMDCLTSKYQSAEEHKLLGYGGIIPCGGLEVSDFTDNGVALENRVFEGRVIPAISVVDSDTGNPQAVVSVLGNANGRSVQIFYFVPCQREGGPRLVGPRIICPN